MFESLGLSRRTALAGGALAAATFASNPLRAQKSSSGSRPNLILFFTDECRADALSSYGNPVCRTPNFDKLAAQGTRFADCHVQYPVCGASRCSLLTGLPVANTGHRSLYYFLRRDEPNLFRSLKEGGYDTFWFGKNDALASESFPLSLTAWRDFGYQRLPNGFIIDSTSPNTMLVDAKLDRRETNDFKLLQLAIDVLEQRERDRPFCIFLPITSPHPPYVAPEGFADMYRAADLPPLAPPGRPKKPIFHEAVRTAYNLDQADDVAFRKVRATYYGQVSYADWLLGELMEALERTGHAKDTVLVASSDHGDYAGDFGMIEKWPNGLETCLTHVPLVARMPGGAAGHVVPEMTELFDVMATFLDLAGIEPRQTIFARSLVAQLEGAPGDPKRAAFTEAGYDIFEPQAFEPLTSGPRNIYTAKRELQNEMPETVTRAASIATPEFKFIWRPAGQSDLYDRKNDQREVNNLIDHPAHADRKQELTQRLLSHFVTTTGVPPVDRDAREAPEDLPMPEFEGSEARIKSVLDR